MKLKLTFKTIMIFCFIFMSSSVSTPVNAPSNCEIVIVGGTLAALGSAISSPSSAVTCLVEPTDRLGGQFGDEGVWHIDFNWMYQQGYPDKGIAYNHANLHPFLAKISAQCNTGDCWVSRNCFLYSCIEPLIQNELAPKISSGNLIIIYKSMVKTVQRIGNVIQSIQIIQRTEQLKKDCRSVDLVLDDWYNELNSEYYSKSKQTIKVNKLIIDASQYGDVLVLARTDYLQGTVQSDTCGQSIVFGSHQKAVSNSKDIKTQSQKEENIKLEQPDDISQPDDFSLAGYTVDQVWRYRRLLGKGLNPKLEEICLQNWNGPGNDYNSGYLFVSQSQINRSDWKGGLNYTTLKEAESRSLRYHDWFAGLSPVKLVLTGEYFRTCNGLSRLPYVRDGRRSVGYKNFTMQQADVTGKYIPQQKLTANVFEDRLGLGFYNMDIHSIKGCHYESYQMSTPLPFFLPGRALTNNKVSNLLVAGRAMAQQFYTSSATRTHTTEFHSGVAAVVMGVYMNDRKISSTWNLIDCTECISELKEVMRKVMPIEWTIAGKTYPSESKHSDVE